MKGAFDVTIVKESYIAVSHTRDYKISLSDVTYETVKTKQNKKKKKTQKNKKPTFDRLFFFFHGDTKS